MQLRVIDAVGRVMEMKQGVAANSTLVVGHSYRPGVYVAEVLQEGRKATVKLVKGAPY
jgi:malonyl CoA-acyl carrier protein transacylase